MKLGSFRVFGVARRSAAAGIGFVSQKQGATGRWVCWDWVCFVFFRGFGVWVLCRGEIGFVSHNRRGLIVGGWRLGSFRVFGSWAFPPLPWGLNIGVAGLWPAFYLGFVSRIWVEGRVAVGWGAPPVQSSRSYDATGEPGGYIGGCTPAACDVSFWALVCGSPCFWCCIPH